MAKTNLCRVPRVYLKSPMRDILASVMLPLFSRRKMFVLRARQCPGEDNCAERLTVLSRIDPVYDFHGSELSPELAIPNNNHKQDFSRPPLGFHSLGYILSCRRLFSLKKPDIGKALALINCSWLSAYQAPDTSGN